MNAFTLLASEFKKLFAKKGVLIAVIGVLLIPIIYAAILLSATWGPYDNLNKVPVAVVNNDTGGVSNGQPINVGNDLVEELKSANTLGWDFVSNEEALSGLDDNKYYMVIEIPEDFSQKAVTVLDKNPQIPELKYIQNEGLNYLASQVTNNAINTLKASLGDKITATYARTLFTQLGAISDGFDTGADGSSQIHEGTVTLSGGTKTLLSSLAEKAPDIAKLADGAATADEGMNTLLSSLAEKAPDIAKLADGAATVDEGTKTLLSSLAEKAPDIAKLANGAATVDEGTKTLLSSLVEKAPDIAKLANGAATADKGAGQLLSSIKDGTGSINMLADGSAQVADGAGNLQAGANQLLNGTQTAEAGSANLATGIEKQILPGANRIAGGLAELNQNGSALATGAQELSDGASTAIAALEQQITPGAVSLNNGVQQAVAGIEELATGYEHLDLGIFAAHMWVEELIPLSENAYKSVKDLEAILPVEIKNSPEFKKALQETSFLAENVPLGDIYVMDELVKGSKQVSEGITKLHAGGSSLSTGAKNLATGLEELTAKAGPLKTGAATLNASIQRVVGAISQLAPGAQQLEQGIQKDVLVGAKSLNTGLTQITAGNKDLVAGAGTLKAGASQVANGNKQLTQSWKTLTNGAAALKEGTGQIAAGTATVKTGWDTLTNGAGSLKEGTGQVSAGTATVKTGWDTLTNGAAALKDGTGQVSAGTATVKTGWGTLTNGAAALKEGTGQISAGTATVKTGWGTLTDGATQLDEGANKLKDGSKELATGLSNGSEEVKSKLSVSDNNIAMFSSPVNVNGEKVNDYTYYRDSTAPYILSLALFVGMLILSLFVDFKKPAILPSSPINWYLGKLLHLSILAVVQGLLLSVFALAVLGLDVESPVLFILFAMFVSLVFMSIIFFLVSLAGNIGRYIALVFIVLQLSITGANLPTVMLPDGLENLSKFLPLTYSNSGFKSVITLGDSGLLSSNVAVLLIYFVLGIALTLVTFILSYKTLSKKFTEQVN